MKMSKSIAAGLLAVFTFASAAIPALGQQTAPGRRPSAGTQAARVDGAEQILEMDLRGRGVNNGIAASMSASRKDGLVVLMVRGDNDGIAEDVRNAIRDLKAMGYPHVAMIRSDGANQNITIFSGGAPGESVVNPKGGAPTKQLIIDGVIEAYPNRVAALSAPAGVQAQGRGDANGVPSPRPD